MTVLLVDDQIRVLSGLISGLDWDTLGVTSIRTASSAAKAKEILSQEPVDILLCDIEMPGENGLSLLRWARNKGMDFVCVFLTSCIISFKVNIWGTNRLRDARDTIAVGQQGQVLAPLVEP